MKRIKVLNWIRTTLALNLAPNHMALIRGLDLPLGLDNVPFVTSHDQLAATVQHLGGTFIDSGSHPRFGIRSFTLPL